jgi:hypothetical protein
MSCQGSLADTDEFYSGVIDQSKRTLATPENHDNHVDPNLLRVLT